MATGLVLRGPTVTFILGGGRVPLTIRANARTSQFTLGSRFLAFSVALSLNV
jgi:hypothetical protein